jgi:hypothetical protein
MVEDNFKYCYVKMQSTKERGVYFNIRVRAESEYYFTLNQESKRKYPRNSKVSYSRVRMLLAQSYGHDIQPIHGVSKAEMEVWTFGRLAPGDYILYVKVDWKRPGMNEAIVSAYGIDNVEFKEVPKAMCPDFHARFFKKRALTNGKPHEYNPACRRFYELTSWGYGYWYYTNQSQSVLEEEITLTVAEGIRFRKPHQPTHAKVVVPPNSDAIVLAVLGDQGYNVSMSYRTLI